jgi:hypothetical protein
MSRSRFWSPRWHGMFISALAAALVLIPLSAQSASLQTTSDDITTDPNLKVAFIGDTGDGDNFGAVLDLIVAEGTDAVVILGDFDYDAANLDAGHYMSVVDTHLGSELPVFLVNGNHDTPAWPSTCGDPDGCFATLFADRLAAAGITPDDPDLDDQMYSLNFRGLRLVSVGETGAISNTIYAPYLNEQLAGDQHIWRICAWHENQAAMQVGIAPDSMGWGVYETCRQQGAIIATAHEHNYSRTRTLIDMSDQTIDPAWPAAGQMSVRPGASFVFVSGSGGRSITGQSRCLPVTSPYGCKGEWASIYSASQGGTFGALFLTFHVDGDPYKARGYFKAITGEVVDQFEIQGAPPADPPPSLIVNGSFEENGDAAPLVPDGWTPKKLWLSSDDGIDCTAFTDGACSFRIKGAGIGKKLVQVIASPGSAGTYTLSFDAMGEDVAGSGNMMVKLRFVLTNGDKKTYKIKVTDTRDFDWTHYSTTFTVPRAYSKVEVTIQYTRSGGTVWFDAVSLVDEP